MPVRERFKTAISREGVLTVSDRPRTRRAFLTFGVLTWALAMLVAVVGVGLVLHESPGAFAFTATLLTLALAFWLLVLRRFTR
jgi:hypothetical protein